jgi:hypothetical protein
MVKLTSNPRERTTPDSVPDPWTVEEIDNLLGLKTPTGDPRESGRDYPNGKENFPDKEEEAEEGAETVKEKANPSISRNPWAKLGLIALSLGAGALFFGTIATQVSNFDYHAAFRGKPRGEFPKPGLDKEKDGPVSLEEENARLKAALALSDQEGRLRAIKPEMEKEPTTTPTAGADRDLPRPVRAETIPVSVRNAPSPAASRPYTPRRPAYAPAPSGVPVSPAYPRSPNRIPSNPSRVERAGNVRVANDKSGNGLETWERLNALGNYGSGALRKGNDRPLQPLSLPPDTVATKGETKDSISGGLIVKSQKITGVLATPIVHADGIEGGDLSVRTEGEIVTGDGTAIAAGAEIVFNLKGINANGMVIAEGKAIITDGETIDLEPGTLTLHAGDGSPLVANEKAAGGSDTGGDILNFLFGAAGKVGELLNRPSSVSSSAGSGFYSQSTNYNSPNYVGAMLEGGIDPLLDRWKERNRSRLAALDRRPVSWWLPVGTPVIIYARPAVGGDR